MTSSTTFLQDNQILKPIPKEWEDKAPEFRRMIPNIRRKFDPHNPNFDPVIRNIIIKSGNTAVIDWLEYHTHQAKFERYCDQIKTQGYSSLLHEDKIWIKRRVVNKKEDGDGALHSAGNIKKLLEVGYPAHELNEKFTPEKKTLWILGEAKKSPNKIPFDMTTNKRIRFPDGKGDMKQFLRDNILVHPNKMFKKRLNQIAPKWLVLLDQYYSTKTAVVKKQNARKLAANELLKLAKLRPRVGADKHGGGFNKITIDYKHTKWFKALNLTDKKTFKQIQKEAPWWFGYDERGLRYDSVCPYGGRHGARKLDLLDYARNKKNKIYKFALSKKAKSKTDIWMKSVFTYCTKSRTKNGYDEKFHRDIIKIRPEIKNIYPL